MGLFSSGRSDSRKPRPASRRAGGRASSADALLDLRRKARRRLIGAVVLVIAAFIGLPMLVQSGKRPVAPDMPIEVVRDPQAPAPIAPPPVAPSAQTEPAPAPATPVESTPPAPAPSPMPVPAPAPSVAVAPAPAVTASRDIAPVTPASAPPIRAAEPVRQPDTPHVAPRVEPARPAPETVKPTETPKPPPKPEARVEPRPETRPEVKPESKPAEPKPAEPKSDGARALALLEGKPVAASAPAPAAHDTSGRFLVQMGAFATEGKVQELQARLRGAGVSTYTETINTASGPRIRLRAGPFSSREAADTVRQKAAGAGIGEAAVLAQ